MNLQSETKTGVSIYTTVFITFLILKLTNNIDWSWWWVTSPIWLPVLAFIVFLVLIFLIGLLYVASTGKNIDELVKKFQKKD